MEQTKRYEGTNKFTVAIATETDRKVDAVSTKNLKVSTSAVLANEARRSYARVCHEVLYAKYNFTVVRN